MSEESMASDERLAALEERRRAWDASRASRRKSTALYALTVFVLGFVFPLLLSLSAPYFVDMYKNRAAALPTATVIAINLLHIARYLFLAAGLAILPVLVLLHALIANPWLSAAYDWLTLTCLGAIVAFLGFSLALPLII